MELWDYIKQLFNQAENSSPSNPVTRTQIVRSEAEVKAYELWKNTLAKRRLIDWIWAEYTLYLTNPNSISRDLDILHTSSSKGFVLHANSLQYTEQDCIHLFDFLKERVLTLGYYAYMSDYRRYARPNWVESVQRHYLKPSLRLSSTGDKAKQLYGNITIELLFRNDELRNLKFQATQYNDHLFDKGTAFKDLMQELLKV